MCLRATILSPFRSNRAIISPVSPRSKASGLTRISVLSMRQQARDFPTDQRRRRTLFLMAAALFAAVFALRVADENPEQPITLLYALPIALLAAELGVGWGMAAATLALGLFAFWD